jgi:hypothetical protein
MLSQETIDFLIERHKNKISLGELLDLYKLKYPNVSYTRVAIKLFDDLKIKYEPEGIYKDGIWIKNPAYNKDYGFNSYFIVEDEQRFLLDDFTTDNGRMVANALNYMINDISYELVSNLEEDLNCSANNFLGAYSDVFVDTVQLSEKFNISVLKEYKEQTAQNKNLSKPVIDSTKLQEEKAKNAQLQAEIERLKAENAELKAQLQDNAQRKSAVDSDDFSIYGHKSELLEILFKVIAEFWADSETPPKNSVIEQWIETNYPVKNYPYVSKAVRQYIATILRPQPKLK